MDMDVAIIAATPLIGLVFACVLPLMKVFTSRRVVFNLFLLIPAIIFFSLGIVALNKVIATNDITTYCFAGWPPPLGICYTLDALSGFLMFTFSLIFLMISLYSIWYFRHLNGYAYFYTLLLIHMSGLIGLVLSSDIFNIYVMIEVVSISAYGMVAFYKHKLKALTSSVRYAILGAFYTSLLLLAVIILYNSLGTLSLGIFATYVQQVNSTNNLLISPMKIVDSTNIILFLMLIFWVGFFLSALFPNHFWLPDAHAEAPIPASALLSSISVLSGFYLIGRFLYVFYKDGFLFNIDLIMNVITLLGVVSVIYSASMLCVEDDVKRILAYSTILNIGYTFMGLGLGTKLGITASLLHAFNHAIGKSAAFFSIGLLIRRYRTRNIYALEGKGVINPITTAFLTLALVHLIGFPPTGGFFSKLYLFQAFMEAKNYWGAIVVIIGTALSVYGYGRLLEHLWHPIQKPKEEEHLSLHTILVLTALMTIIFLVSIIQEPLHTLLSKAAESLRNTGHNYIKSMNDLIRTLLPHT